MEIKVDNMASDKVFWRMVEENLDKIEDFYKTQLLHFTEQFHILTLQVRRFSLPLFLLVHSTSHLFVLSLTPEKIWPFFAPRRAHVRPPPLRFRAPLYFFYLSMVLFIYLLLSELV